MTQSRTAFLFRLVQVSAFRFSDLPLFPVAVRKDLSNPPQSEISNLKSAIPSFSIDLPGHRRSIGGTTQRATRP
jgi:hypothetical protein